MESVLPMNESEQSEVNAPSQQYDGKPFTALRSYDLVGKYFETLEAAEKFFYAYAHVVGFSVRRDIKRRGNEGEISIRQWFCSCEGFRTANEESDGRKIRNPKKDTRTGCTVAFLVNYCPDKKQYVVKKFNTDHNHPCVAPDLTHHMRSARDCRESDVAQVTVLRNVSIRACHAYEYLVDIKGGYVNVGFRIKDLYNKLDASRREIMLDGDAEAALAFLNGRCVGEEKFYCKFSVDEENKLCNLFWRDTRSLIDYENYGDVVLFDATYKTNCYGKPLVLFVGSSNHLTSIVFGCAFLLDETIESYVWALKTFISSMNDKKPVAVLTDSDESMRRALEIVLPGCPHRLCSWHIGKNVSTNVKKKEMRERFIDIMWNSTTPEEFETSWTDMIQKFSPKNISWFEMMYAKRMKWVEAYCKGQFFARMRSTQRCEGMNKYVKDFLNGVKLIEVVPGIVRAQGRLRSKYSEIEYNCRYSKHRLRTQLRDLEEDASKLYTDNVFFVVQKEIERVGGLIPGPVVQSDGFKTYNMHHHKRVHQWYSVVYFQGQGDTRFVCSCKKMEYEGIPCCHIFLVLRHEQILKIPVSLVMKRWTITEKSNSGKLDTHRHTSFTEDGESKLRFGCMADRLSKLALRASYSKESYEMVSAEIDKLERKLEAITIVPDARRQDDGHERHANLIRDPDVVKTKGKRKEATKSTGKQARKCSKCSGYGHNRQSCGKNQSSASSDEEIDGEGEDEGCPQASEAGPSSTNPYQQQVNQFPIPPGFQYQGPPGMMQSLLADVHFNGMQNFGSGYPHMHVPGLFNEK